MLSAIVSVVIIRILKMLTVPDVMIMVTMRMKMKYDDLKLRSGGPNRTRHLRSVRLEAASLMT